MCSVFCPPNFIFWNLWSGLTFHHCRFERADPDNDFLPASFQNSSFHGRCINVTERVNQWYILLVYQYHICLQYHIPKVEVATGINGENYVLSPAIISTFYLNAFLQILQLKGDFWYVPVCLRPAVLPYGHVHRWWLQHRTLTRLLSQVIALAIKKNSSLITPPRQSLAFF
jgi:hypothetical protein